MSKNYNYILKVTSPVGYSCFMKIDLDIVICF